MEHRITVTETKVISVYLDPFAAMKYIASLVHDGIAFSYEFA